MCFPTNYFLLLNTPGCNRIATWKQASMTRGLLFRRTWEDAVRVVRNSGGVGIPEHADCVWHSQDPMRIFQAWKPSKYLKLCHTGAQFLGRRAHTTCLDLDIGPRPSGLRLIIRYLRRDDTVDEQLVSLLSIF
jgi:hypothetical protein